MGTGFVEELGEGYGSYMKTSNPGPVAMILANRKICNMVRQAIRTPAAMAKNLYKQEPAKQKAGQVM